MAKKIKWVPLTYEEYGFLLRKSDESVGRLFKSILKSLHRGNKFIFDRKYFRLAIYR